MSSLVKWTRPRVLAPPPINHLPICHTMHDQRCVLVDHIPRSSSPSTWLNLISIDRLDWGFINRFSSRCSSWGLALDHWQSVFRLPSSHPAFPANQSFHTGPLHTSIRAPSLRTSRVCTNPSFSESASLIPSETFTCYWLLNGGKILCICCMCKYRTERINVSESTNRGR